MKLLRELLAGTQWLEETRSFAGALRGSLARSPQRRGGLLLLGTEVFEPWHLAAHLDSEAAWCALPELSPTLVRWRVPRAAPAHLSVGLDRLAAAGRGETLLVVAPLPPVDSLLERVHDARKAGVTVLAMEDSGGELSAIAHDALLVPGELHPHACGTPAVARTEPPAGPVRSARPAETIESAETVESAVDGSPFDLLQHLVSAAAGEEPPGSGSARAARWRDRLTRIAEQLTSPPPTRW